MVSSPPRRHDVSSTAGWLSPRSPAPAEVGSAGLAVASATGRLSPRSPAADRRSLRAYVFGAEVAKPAQSPAQRQRPKPISPVSGVQCPALRLVLPLLPKAAPHVCTPAGPCAPAFLFFFLFLFWERGDRVLLCQEVLIAC
eukprot:SAG31_NODE_555_length_14169_cov_19.798721_8_plen_141_part_00